MENEVGDSAERTLMMMTMFVMTEGLKIKAPVWHELADE